MNKKVILIIIAVIAALALLITGTVLLFKSSFVSRGNNNSDSSNNSSSISSSSKKAVTNSDGSLSEVSTTESSAPKNTSDKAGKQITSSEDKDGKSSEQSTSAKPAGDTTTFTVGKVSGKKGDKVTLPVEISDNQGFMACLAEFNYDTSALKYTGYKRSSLLKDYEVKEENGTIKFMTVAEKDVTANGTALYLEFEIISKKAQESDVKIKIDKGNIGNYDEQLVPVKTVNGSVIIK